MPLLYYWRFDNYTRDRAFSFGYHLNQNSPAMVSVSPGDSVWAFTRRSTDGLYVLAAELVVRALTRNPPNHRYGAYKLWGDLWTSRYFDVDVGPSVEPLIRALSVRARGDRLGQSFQGNAAVRTITDADHRLLANLARDLPVLERVSVYPEDEIEAGLVHGEAARSLVVRETRAEYTTRVAYLYETVNVHRARRHVERLQELYAGRCQLCLYDPRRRYGHHITWLSRGGEDELENMVLICPNHHAAIHRDDAPFDYGTLAFTFSIGRVEPVQLNEHLPRSA